ncbi:MAG TPA: hypothetical protein DEQ77_02055 [Candidatus Omnitrophica bacterium]|nr:hypothetical protein [Candidatus Omnitrophota bacterium]
MDISHAICYAKDTGADWYDYLRGFFALKPSMFHLSDGDSNSGTDTHSHINDGNYDWGRIIPLLPEDAVITIETKKDSAAGLEDFRKDAKSLKALFLQQNRLGL